MSALNQSIQFKDLPDSIQKAFSSSQEVKNETLPAGKILYRFSGHDGLSAWWSDIAQLSNLLNAAKAKQRNVHDYIRTESAVLRSWNSMQNLIVGKLRRPVNGLAGTISPQNEADQYRNPQSIQYKAKYTKPVYMKGGAGQYFIPNLTSEFIDIIIPAGTVNIYDNPDDIIDFLKTYKILG